MSLVPTGAVLTLDKLGYSVADPVADTVIPIILLKVSQTMLYVIIISKMIS